MSDKQRLLLGRPVTEARTEAFRLFVLGAGVDRQMARVTVSEARRASRALRLYAWLLGCALGFRLQVTQVQRLSAETQVQRVSQVLGARVIFEHVAHARLSWQNHQVLL
tara:strand:- start:689 stop:1015 length:327 start_codon:yes stop_codon:yes gene_type:complete